MYVTSWRISLKQLALVRVVTKDKPSIGDWLIKTILQRKHDLFGLKYFD